MRIFKYVLTGVILMITMSAAAVSVNTKEYCYEFELFKRAIVKVESGGNPKAVNKHDGSTGILQIQPCLVRAANNYLKRTGSTERFTLQDRFNVEKSWKMFFIYQQTIWKQKDPTFEQMARVWNGGPGGCKRSVTVKYWKKIEREMAKMKKKDPDGYLYSDNRTITINLKSNGI